MWRHYYDKKYVALARDLYDTARIEQGFSPWDSARIAIAAASAAGAFQPTASRAEAQKALTSLETYFGLLSRAAPVPVDAAEAARSELSWWQARRDAVPAEEYGLIIARVSTLLYGVEGPDVQRAGVLRAQAMAYHDAHADNYDGGGLDRDRRCFAALLCNAESGDEQAAMMPVTRRAPVSPARNLL